MDNHRAETQGEEKKTEGKEAIGGLTRRNNGREKEPIGSEQGEQHLP